MIFSESVENVELTTDGLFLTLGNIMPPFLDSGLLFVLVLVLVDTEIFILFSGAVIGTFEFPFVVEELVELDVIVVVEDCVTG